MDTDEESDEGNEACEMAFQSALEKAMDYCGDGAVERATGQFFGLDNDYDCGDVLADGLDAGSTMEETRQWVHCRSLELMEEKEITFERATKLAWDESEDEKQPSFDSSSGLDL